MSRVWMLLVIGACAQATPADRASDSGATPDASAPVMDAPAGHGSGNGSGNGSGTGSGSGSGTGNGCTFSGALAKWDMSAQPGTEASVAASTTATGVTAGALTRAATLTAQSGAGSINGSNWPTAAALDATKYYAFTLTPPTGCTMTLTNVAIDLKASGTGPANGAIATSKDSFAATTPVGTAAPSTPAVTVTTSGQIELRVYGFAATGTGGTLRVQNTLTVNGTIQ